MNALPSRLLALVRWSVRRGDPCARHRDVLLDVFEDGARQRGVDASTDRALDAALDHLGRCRACTSELGDLTLVIAGLRRLGVAARRATPPPGGWLRVRRRLQLQRAPMLRSSLAPLAGLVAVPLVVAIALSPRADVTAPAMLDQGAAPDAVSVTTGVPTTVPGGALAGEDGRERAESAAMALVLFRHGYPNETPSPAGTAPVRPEFLPQ